MEKTKIRKHLKDRLRREPSDGEVENAMGDANIAIGVIVEMMGEMDQRLKDLESVL